MPLAARILLSSHSSRDQAWKVVLEMVVVVGVYSGCSGYGEYKIMLKVGVYTQPD
jgi:hypothetical protein